jgi:hypothetical protein
VTLDTSVNSLILHAGSFFFFFWNLNRPFPFPLESADNIGDSTTADQLTISANGQIAYAIKGVTIDQDSDATFTVALATGAVDDGDCIGIYAAASGFDPNPMYGACLEKDVANTRLNFKQFSDTTPDFATMTVADPTGGAASLDATVDPAGNHLRATVSNNGGDQQIVFEASSDGSTWTAVETFTITSAWTAVSFGFLCSLCCWRCHGLDFCLVELHCWFRCFFSAFSE